MQLHVSYTTLLFEVFEPCLTIRGIWTLPTIRGIWTPVLLFKVFGPCLTIRGIWTLPTIRGIWTLPHYSRYLNPAYYSRYLNPCLTIQGIWTLPHYSRYLNPAYYSRYLNPAYYSRYLNPCLTIQGIWTLPHYSNPALLFEPCLTIRTPALLFEVLTRLTIQDISTHYPSLSSIRGATHGRPPRPQRELQRKLRPDEPHPQPPVSPEPPPSREQSELCRERRPSLGRVLPRGLKLPA